MNRAHRLSFARLLVAGLALAAPASRAIAATDPAPTPAAGSIVIPLPEGVEAQEIRARYACDDTSAAEVVYINAGPVSLATLTRKGEFVVLANVLSGSGARYAGGVYVWWSKGREASLYDLTRGEDAEPVATCTQE
ncbi:MliC family protein [Ancylobacter sp. A5.8]|uniref:MliC family protein n=1 Tax=Ancylobacter gelatini TaxID=2919920 RepID=UPI001F4D9D73|nr:MliC family protein [Ancylobacter gelatini]MCJ8144795.1 MliC family protein [Ancylobacter gelatini]